MIKITCGVCECSHNKFGACYANFVSIAGTTAQTNDDTCCNSFMNRVAYDELTETVISKTSCAALECKVKTCAHYKDCGCNLDHIKINGDNVKEYSETNCLSFQATR